MGVGREPGFVLSAPCLFGKSLLVLEGTVPGREAGQQKVTPAFCLCSSLSVVVKILKGPGRVGVSQQKQWCTTQRQKTKAEYKMFKGHTHIPSELTKCVAV